MEYLDTALTVLGFMSPVAFGGAAVAIKKGTFYIKALIQARDTFEDWKTTNKTIYNKIQADPNKKELAQVLSGSAAKIEGLTGLDL